MLPLTPLEPAQRLNRDCACATLQPERLRVALESASVSSAGVGESGASGQLGVMGWLAETRPHLFAATPVFLSASVAVRINQAVAAIEQAAALPGWTAQALARAADSARIDHGPAGVFMGYDFHLADDGPRLIEINTNAGGALLNVVLARAHDPCCGEWPVLVAAPKSDSPWAQAPEQDFLAMFRAEWAAQRGNAPLQRIAIVDDAPETQYLAPEFTLFRELFRQAGYDSHVVDAAVLRHHDGRLWCGDDAIDLVYNRLTDFALDEARHAALRTACDAGDVVVTPHPRVHALFADKRNLATLSDDAQLAAWGLDAAAREVIAAVVPATQEVTPENADALWAERRQLFFKPFAGYAGKAAYRGEKITKKVWEDIRSGGFVAQALVPPAQRRVGSSGALKYDIRAYAYRGRVLLFAARLYEGQTTNFRTEGGGFAPVIVLPDGVRPA
ncbi:MAG: hypothetical protein Q8J78_02525 [Moraxellaceae bacterium]|nr:hypothetical protein [Moraxellaceae bacterium]